MKILILLFISLSCVLSSQAQSYSMTNGSITACSGTFYDSGGNLFGYTPLEYYTFTICSSTPGGRVRVSFSSFNVELNYDYLMVYDGNSTAAPLIGNYTGTVSPGVITASGTNATGCLTFVFSSDAITQTAGWAAAISCLPPCQTITANFVSSVEAPMADGVIRICPGETVTFNGSGTFSSSPAGATFEWFFGDGTSGTGASSSHMYASSGSYLVNLRVTDPAGCRSTNNINRNVQVSAQPTITTSASPSSVCAGQPSNLTASVAMNTITPSCTPAVSGTTFLPDGSGVSYSTTINVNCYAPTATVTSASDVTNICLNMEHSYMGDLGITLTCPNGQSMSILTYPSSGASANLGSPWATAPVDGSSATTTPGTGSSYCFTPSATVTLSAGILTGGTFTSGNGPGTYTDDYVPAGTYMSDQPFTNLVGCPLNGAWTITVTDNISSDNGYIFSWDVNFSSSFATPPAFTPTIVSQNWASGAGVVTTSSTTATVYPNSTGTPCYNYQVTDNFGCTWTQPQCITVGCSVLSVDLLAFNVDAVDNRYAHLTWSTASEEANQHFTIEKSTDGLQWTLLGTLPGHGTTHDMHEYEFDDYLPSAGLSYYRLGQIDENGQPSWSDPRAVIFGTLVSEAGMAAFPNPATERLVITGAFAGCQDMTIQNSLGQNVKYLVSMEQQSSNLIQLNISRLSPGVYFVSNGNTTISFIKE